MDKDLEIRKFIEVIKDEGNNENKIQRYLEENTFLIPLPFLLNHHLHFSFVFKKYTLPHGRDTDFLYLTKSTAEWQVVLVELESSNKRIFTTSGQSTYFHSEFNHAYDQITEWKSQLDENKEVLKKQLEPLMFHMHTNPISFKYVLILGRSSELDTPDKIKLYNQKNTDSVRVLTYDSLLSAFKTYPVDHKILVNKKVNGFEIINLAETETSAFAYLNKSQLFFSEDIRTELVNRGYNIEEWENGKSLAVNNKETIENFGKKMI